MNGFSRTPFVSRSREAGLTEAEGRRAWLLFLAVAKANATMAINGRFPTPEDDAAFRGLIVRLKSRFPVPRGCAQDVAAAALRMAHALGEVTGPQDRDELGELLLRAVNFLDRLLYDQTHDRAGLSRRIAGESGD